MNRLRSRQRAGRPVQVLHHLAAVLSLANQMAAGTGVVERRRRQRLAMAQRLLDPLPKPLRSSQEGEWFWSLLRWGGCGLLVSWLLQR